MNSNSTSHPARFHRSKVSRLFGNGSRLSPTLHLSTLHFILHLPTLHGLPRSIGSLRSLLYFTPLVFGFSSILALSHQEMAIAQATAQPITQSTPTQLAQLTSGRPTLRTGSQGNEVLQVQGMLRLLGYYTGPVDGVFEASTAAGVAAFQQAAGVFADGIVGPDTWNRLLPSSPGSIGGGNSGGGLPPVVNNPTPTPPPVNNEFPVLRFGSEGAAVSRLQERLAALQFYFDVVDGSFGPGTEDAVKAAQQYYGLEPDGIVGPATWDALF